VIHIDPNAEPRTVDVSDAHDEEDEEQILRKAWPPAIAYVMDFLKTAEGKEFGKKVFDFIESLRKRPLGRQNSESMLHGIARYALAAGIIGAAVWLRVVDKLDTVMVGLLSLTLGYLPGRQQSKRRTPIPRRSGSSGRSTTRSTSWCATRSSGSPSPAYNMEV